MRNLDLIQLKSIIEDGENYSLNIEDLEKVVAYKQEFEKYLQTYRLSLMINKIDERGDNEKVLGNQIDIIEVIMKDLQETVEGKLKQAQEAIRKKKIKKQE